MYNHSSLSPDPLSHLLPPLTFHYFYLRPTQQVKLYNETKYSGRSVFVQVESGICIATNPTSAIDLSPPKIRSLRIDRPACICYFDFSSKKCEKGKTESFGIPGAKEVKSGLQSWRCVAPSPKGVESGLDSEGEIEDESSEEVEVAMNRRPYCGRWWPICEKRTAQ